jgi:hypothetical protein
MNLREVRDRLRADDNGKWDQLIARDEMRMQAGRLRFPRQYRADHPTGLALTRWAESQLCQRLNIPTDYYRRCPPVLKDANANAWLHRDDLSAHNGDRRREDRPERWLLRARGDTLRGILSERYAKLNNADVFRSLEPLVKERYEVAWLAITEESWHLRLIDPELARDVTPGDRVYAGLHIANSEVGKRSVTIDSLVFRTVCANGLIRLVKGRSLLHQRHVSLSPARFEAALAAAIREALVQGTGFLERLLWAAGERLPDAEAALSAIAARWGLSQTLATQVRETLSQESRSHQETLYGLVNAVTNVAQNQDPDERYTLEALAGILLERGASRMSGENIARSRRQSFIPEASEAEEFTLEFAG